jgi:Tol biopolymer transport system component
MARRWRCIVPWAVLLILVAGCGDVEPAAKFSPLTPTTTMPPLAETLSPPEDTAVSPTVAMLSADVPLPTATSLPPTPRLATSEPSPTASPPARSLAPAAFEGQFLFSIYPEGDIAVMNADGSDRRVLLDERRAGELLTDRFAAWQSGGNAISYVVDDFERAEIWLMPLEGGPGQFLVADVASVTSHSWSPNGERLAFVSAKRDICILEVSDQTITKLDIGDLRDARDPAWSPDGSALAFSASDSRNQDIYVVRVDGSALDRITGHPAPDKHPEWSPDGMQLAFSSTRRSPRFSDIYTLDLRLGTEEKGNQPTQLTAADSLEVRPDWSPGGSWIVYLSFELGSGHGTIYAVRAGGGSPVQVTAGNVYHSFRWRP